MREMRQVKKEKSKNQWQDKTAGWIAKKIILTQLCLSRYLQKQERRMTAKQKKAALFLFCLLGSAYFLYLLGSALLNVPPPYSFYNSLPAQEIAQPPPDTGYLPYKQPKIFDHKQNHKQ